MVLRLVENGSTRSSNRRTLLFMGQLNDSRDSVPLAGCAAAACFVAADTVGQLRTGRILLAVPLCWRHAALLVAPLVVDWWDSGA